ncbi:hypothetical protein ISF_06662 [Cordyceps fumosorosea ARSEF 2679]|uniref:Uncharacterized protein n=1 Tax=Cordyceps fumosorosea (strain ARSEF 2679) TaxID=1081104 RepID=A0A167RS06_CORFA|nr:hypothetical protein ISF_06662 [Cordyceps fumosorosea ARSEF 2679]OAA58879.1 hypothetical protein ISF_06662 [Cordyceps fumosorosea ARSEF 2679]
MFPPVDDHVLENNPDFARLYRTLTTSILNPDGTSRRSKESKENEAIRKRRHKQHTDQHRLQAAKQHLLERAIATASPADQSRRVPGSRAPSGSHDPTHADHAESLVDLLLALPPLLDTTSPIPPDSAALLLRSKPLSDLATLAPSLAALVSSHLHAAALDLTLLTHHPASPSTAPRHIPALEHDYASLRDRLASSRATLLSARLRAAAALTRLLHVHAETLAQLSPEAAAALRAYGAHLRDAKVRGAERVRNLQRELREYGVDADDGGGSAKERMMREMAKAHEEIGRQVDEVTLDLERLHTGQ